MRFHILLLSDSPTMLKGLSMLAMFLPTRMCAHPITYVRREEDEA
jgi:hypothetical protein